MINIRKLERELWEAADLLRADSEVTSQEYCMPVLGLIFLRYAYSRFKFVEADILKDRPIRNGRVLPVEADDFKTKSAIYLPEKARYDYLINLPDNTDMGQAINLAMELIEEQSAQLKGVLPKNYNILKNDLLRELLRIFNNSAFNEMKDDIIGRIYEYFLNKFAPVVAADDGVFFTPKSLVQMIVNIIEPNHGTVLDPACGSGGMFVASADFIEQFGTSANTAMTFYGQEKLEYNAKLCIMNMAVHGLNAKIVSGDEANSFYNDAHNLEGSCALLWLTHLLMLIKSSLKLHKMQADFHSVYQVLIKIKKLVMQIIFGFHTSTHISMKLGVQVLLWLLQQLIVKVRIKISVLNL